MTDLSTLHCPNCGAPVHANDRTCEYCGSLLLVSQPAELALPAIAQAQQLAAQMREHLALNPYDGDAYYQPGLATFTLGARARPQSPRRRRLSQFSARFAITQSRAIQRGSNNSTKWKNTPAASPNCAAIRPNGIMSSANSMDNLISSLCHFEP